MGCTSDIFRLRLQNAWRNRQEEFAEVFAIRDRFCTAFMPEMANRTNKQNRTFSRSCSVCSSSAPHRTEPNSTFVQFVFVRVSNIGSHVRFCSNRTRTEQHPCSVRVRQVRTIQSKVEDSAFLSIGLIPGLGSHYYKEWLRKFVLE